MISLRDLLRERAGLDATLGEEQKNTRMNSSKKPTGKGEEGKMVERPLQSAPSLLAVLMKLMGMTAGIASAGPVFLATGTGTGATVVPRRGPLRRRRVLLPARRPEEVAAAAVAAGAAAAAARACRCDLPHLSYRPP